MGKTFVLIDYENVQPKVLPSLPPHHDYSFFLFTGPNAPKPEFDFAASLQKLGPDGAQYLKIKHGGHQSIDLHIAYTIGKLWQQHPKARFYVISKDTDFDTLIQTLRDSGLTVGRHKALADLPGLGRSSQPAAAPKPSGKVPTKAKLSPKPAVSKTADVQTALDYLSKMKTNKPRTRTTLQKALETTLQKTHNQQQVSELIAALINQNHLCDSEGSITYL